MKVYFVGFGPGSADLLTLRAYRLLKEADLIIYPGSIIPESSLSEFKGKKVNSHGMKLEEIVDLIEKAARSGKRVVRVQSGDPSVYGAINEQIRELERRGISCEVVPGVSSFAAAAAKLRCELASSEIPALVVTRARGRTLADDELEKFAATNSTLVLLLSADKLAEIAERVAEIRGGDEPVAVAYRVEQEGEKIITGTLSDIAAKAAGIKSTAVVVIGKALRREGRSVLYA